MSCLHSWIATRREAVLVRLTLNHAVCTVGPQGPCAPCAKGGRRERRRAHTRHRHTRPSRSAPEPTQPLRSVGSATKGQCAGRHRNHQTHNAHKHSTPSSRSELVVRVSAAVGFRIQVDMRHRSALERQRLELLQHGGIVRLTSREDIVPPPRSCSASVIIFAYNASLSRIQHVCSARAPPRRRRHAELIEIGLFSMISTAF